MTQTDSSVPSTKALLALAASTGEAQIPPGGGAPYTMAPDSCSAMALEHLRNAPISTRIDVSFNDEASFTDYVTRFGNPEATVVYASDDDRTMSVTAIIDHDAPGAPSWRRHRASWDCSTSRSWLAWTRFDGSYMSQVDFATFMHEHFEDVYAPEGNPEAPSPTHMLEVSKSLRAQRKVAFSSATELKNGDVDFSFQQMTSAGAGPKGRLAVPAEFWIAIPVMKGGQHYEMKAELRYKISDDGALTIGYRLVKWDSTREDAFSHAFNRIRDSLDTLVADVYRGNPPAATKHL